MERLQRAELRRWIAPRNQSKMRVLLALLLAVPACYQTPRKPAHDSVRVAAPAAVPGADAAPSIDSATVFIRGPTLVAFYPEATQAQVDSSEELATVLDDFAYHLSTATDSLRALGIAIWERPAGRIQLMEAGRRRQFVLAKDSADVGYVFLAPGRADRVYYGVMTNSDLVDVAHEFLRNGP